VPTNPVVAGLLAETHGASQEVALAFGHHEDRTPMHSYAATREAAMAAFAKAGGGSSAVEADDGGIEREDCTPMACYRSIYAPRTGGAYDSHHRTAGIAGCTRRRGDVQLGREGSRQEWP